MTNKSTLRTEVGERVEQSDFQYASQDSQRHLIESVMQDFVAGDSASGGGQPSNFVIDGFSTTAVGTVVTVAGGKMIVGMRENGVAEFGMLLSSGATSRNRDLNGLADATYGIYVRAEFHDDRFINRLFWNALAASPTETPKSIPTRRAEDWNIVVELVSPGPEWQLVATAAKAGAVLMIVDKRVFLFDTNDGTVADSVWGGGNDRNANRGSFGVKSLYRCLKAIQKQLIGIIGGTTWMASAVTGSSAGSNGPRSLTQLNDEKFGRIGAQDMLGPITVPVGSDGYSGAGGFNIGSITAAWRDIFARGLRLGDGLSLIFGVRASNDPKEILFEGAGGINRGFVDYDPVGSSGGSGLMELTADEIGLRAITRNFLGVNCDGQNGVVKCTFGFNVPIVGAGGFAAINIALVQGTGTPLTATDHITAISFGVSFQGAGPVVMTQPPQMTGNDQMTIWVKNTDQTNPSILVPMTGSCLVMRD